MPDPVNTRMLDLIVLIAMLFGVVTSIVGFSWLSQLANKSRDEILLGVQNGMALSLKQRWDKFTGDWVPQHTIVMGGAAYVGFIFLKLARLSEDVGVTWLGYFGAGLHLWGVLMLLFFLPVEAFTLVRHLRDLRKAEAG
jgi:hypothetical protein